MTLYAFRMDDVTPTMCRRGFARFRALFEEHGIRPLLGVVPDNRDPALEIDAPDPGFWEEMRALRAAGWSVAQHGHQHRCDAPDGGILGVNRRGEFASLPYDRQLEKIERGRARLREEGLETDVWMAPAHAFDRATLRALRHAGFRTVTDGHSLFPYERLGLRFIPCQMGVPRPVPVGVVTVYIHASWTPDAEFERFRRFVERHRRRIRDFSELLALPPRPLVRRVTEPIVGSARVLASRYRYPPARCSGTSRPSRRSA